MRILQRSVGHASLETADALDHCNNRMIYQALVIINIYRGLPFRVIASVRIPMPPAHRPAGPLREPYEALKRTALADNRERRNIP